MQETEQRWYALYVRSHHEKKVATQLEAKQQTVFLPMYAARHKWVDRWKTVHLPLFPGYVFCQFDAAKRSRVLATSGIIDVVRYDGQPAALEASEIESIRSIVQSKLQAEPFYEFIRGQQVLISDGPLHGVTGTLIETRKGPRLVVSVDLLCRSVLVEIDRDWAIPAPDSGTVEHSKLYQTIHSTQ
jgi:transcription antitermination factor NusG